MTVNKRKKISRYRGSHTHGGGAKKKRRGAGHRGGRGMAGSGKRADTKKPTIIKLYGYQEYFGRHGFVSKNHVEQKAINLEEIELKADRLVKEGKAKLEKGVYIINLHDIGFDKLLGMGRVTKKFSINAEAASAKAIQKIEDAGGKVQVAPQAEKENKS